MNKSYLLYKPEAMVSFQHPLLINPVQIQRYTAYIDSIVAGPHIHQLEGFIMP